MFCIDIDRGVTMSRCYGPSDPHLNRVYLALWALPLMAQPKPKAAPRGKPQPAQLRRRKGAAVAKPRPEPKSKLSLYDPLNAMLVPSLMSEGDAFPVTGMVRSDFTQGAVTGTRVMVVTNCGSSGTIMSELKWNNGGVVFTVPTMANQFDQGGPTATRAMKASLTICNTTRYQNIGGSVTVLHTNQRLTFPGAPFGINTAEFSEFVDRVKGHPHAKRYSGAEFVKPRTWIAHPTNETDYSKYVQFDGAISDTGFSLHYGTYPGATLQNRPMSTILAVFEDVSNSQDYTCTARASWYARYGLDTVLGQSQRPVPTASAAVINKARDTAERHAHVHTDVVTM